MHKIINLWYLYKTRKNNWLRWCRIFFEKEVSHVQKINTYYTKIKHISRVSRRLGDNANKWRVDEQQPIIMDGTTKFAGYSKKRNYTRSYNKIF